MRGSISFSGCVKGACRDAWTHATIALEPAHERDVFAFCSPVDLSDENMTMRMNFARPYWGTSLIRNGLFPGPYSRPMPRGPYCDAALEGWAFLVSEVPL